MTREKAIEQELKKRHESPHYNAGFVEGAHWADEHPECFSEAQKAAEFIFPGLKESEDERIRRELCKAIWTYIPYEEAQKYITWLEKQGNTNIFDVPKTPIKDAVEITSRMQHIEDDMKPIAEFIMNYANWDLHKDKWNRPTLTVPLFRVLDALIQRGKPYGECAQNIEKQGEKDPCIGCTNDKGCVTCVDDNMKETIKSKFKVGDWVLNNVCLPMQIVSIKDGMYVFTEGDAISVSFVDENYHLWIIQDAKEGGFQD